MILKELPIKKLRPNNFYINKDKLEKIRKIYNEDKNPVFPPVLVGIIDGEYALIDGHSRAMAAFENGKEFISAQIHPIEEVPGPTKLYLTIHNKSKEMGLESIESLNDRIISNFEHEILWVKYCDNLLKELQ